VVAAQRKLSKGDYPADFEVDNCFGFVLLLLLGLLKLLQLRFL
jgi:hypothetical protein